jgi:Ca-activated chloride channel homolog
MRPKEFAPVLLILAVLMSRGQTSSRAFTISDNVNLVVLDVSVSEPHGGYVTGLHKDNFEVFEDRRPRPISQFASVDTPMTVGLVVDNSGSMARKRPEVIMAGLAFAKESNPRDEFFVINFNNSVVRGLPESMPFTDNFQLLRDALYFGQPHGQTALYDAIAYALRHLEFSHRERRALIVISDGGDNVSHMRLAELIQLIEASRATVYTVGLFDPEANELNPRVLRRFASVSGGEYFQPALDEVTPVFAKISKDLRNRYTLAFVPGAADRRRVRSVRVRAAENGRKFIVRSRTWFIASAPPLVAESRQ